jgi:hypothetical protein
MLNNNFRQSSNDTKRCSEILSNKFELSHEGNLFFKHSSLDGFWQMQRILAQSDAFNLGFFPLLIFLLKRKNYVHKRFQNEFEIKKGNFLLDIHEVTAGINLFRLLNEN